MSQPSRTEAIARFLQHATHQDLADMYSYDMECQVNVGQDGGEPISGEYQGRAWRGWSDGNTTWKPFRIPWNAMTDPKYTDTLMKFDLAAHAEGIGMTGWDWKNKLSRWVAFDFDAITGHSDRHARKCTDSELNNIRDSLTNIPWITLRYSTSGSGLHVYVFLKPIPTQTHTEHQALARAILGMMSAITGFDFATKVDICGGNMWVYHRKMKGTRGLQLISKGIELDDIPVNWRDHINVVTGRRRRTLPQFIPDDDTEASSFEELTGQRPRIPLDVEHRRLIKWLTERADASYVWWWDTDHHMLVTHTKLLEQAHEELQLRGVFKTSSTGSSQQNCFCFPLRRGAWTVRRYSPGVAEHPSWTQDGAGFTRTYLNRDPDLASLARAYGANELKNGAFSFQESAIAAEVALHLGAEIKLPPHMIARKTRMRTHKDGRLLVEVERDAKDNMAANQYPGWEPEKTVWTKIFDVRTSQTADSSEVGDYDDFIRHVVSNTDEDAGWTIKSESRWIQEPLTHIRSVLCTMGHKSGEVNSVVGSSVMKSWTLTNLPFQPEYPGNRQWNRHAVQMRYTPTLDRDNLAHPTWTHILEHLGKGLTESISKNAWCKANGIFSGADYLRLWCASLFQYPNEPLPYLFFYGHENSGKSIFHEAISLLVTHGVERADNALTNQSGFNGELETAILCVIEEVNLSKSNVALNRIKDWLLTRNLPIHKKGLTPFITRNTTHWVQCANTHTFCPVTIGDTRITMIHVPDLKLAEMIPKRTMLPQLEKEGPDFLASLLSLEIPSSPDRLMVPIIETEIKRITARSNRTLLEAFLDSETYNAPGYSIAFKEFYEKFYEWVDLAYRLEWSKNRVSREMPPEYRIGRHAQSNSQHIANISWEEPTEERPEYRLVMRGKTEFIMLAEVPA